MAGDKVTDLLTGVEATARAPQSDQSRTGGPGVTTTVNYPALHCRSAPSACVNDALNTRGIPSGGRERITTCLLHAAIDRAPPGDRGVERQDWSGARPNTAQDQEESGAAVSAPTSTIPFGHGVAPAGQRIFQVDFDFLEHRLDILVNDGSSRSLLLLPRSVADFYHEFMAALEALGIQVQITTSPVEVENTIPFDQDQVHASYDPAYVTRWWRILLQTDRPPQPRQASWMRVGLRGHSVGVRRAYLILRCLLWPGHIPGSQEAGRECWADGLGEHSGAGQ